MQWSVWSVRRTSVARGVREKTKENRRFLFFLVAAQKGRNRPGHGPKSGYERFGRVCFQTGSLASGWPAQRAKAASRAVGALQRSLGSTFNQINARLCRQARRRQKQIFRFCSRVAIRTRHTVSDRMTPRVALR
jgi:hypothetical protein